MNWFDTSGLTSLAKTALKEAQKTIDKALDIQDEEADDQSDEATALPDIKSGTSDTIPPQKDSSDFFASWGLTVSAESAEAKNERQVVTESPSKSPQSLWGSFAGSFFEPPKSDAESTAIVRPPKAKSMNLIADATYDSTDNLFFKKQYVSDSTENVDIKKDHYCKSEDAVPKDESRRDSSRSNRLSLVSSRNSSDSVEVLSHSLKTTPDSEVVSVHSMSHSSSAGQKITSESVEILPDSLMSPSSIECLGFDSYSSSSTSSNLSPGDVSDKKSTPVGDRTERAGEAGDSVSLVADDDEDTISYNSVSECTAPTVLDTDEKLSVSPNLRAVRSAELHKKFLEKDLMQIDQALPHISQKMQVSENSSNDGSWSDRTLNADNDSVILDSTLEEQCKGKESSETEDFLVDKLSDSSSFYNVKVTMNISQSESSSFVNVDKQQCEESSAESSQKDNSVKERTSPTSSDSKSDLVKIGSDRTSGHTSGDELETATSSDIEIIPSPNSENHAFCRNSPAKYPFKQTKDENTSSHLVDLVLGKSLATKIRGHNRELSEASVQSNTSDESQGSENERLRRRLCEMAEILDARECRLMEVSRNNAELVESNADLKAQVESLMVKHEGTDIINEDYTQRMSALEKKFQQSIREKDQLRKQLDALKSESSKKCSTELENTLKESEEVIAQLQEEGEKLARQQLQHSTIIKKLRAKEKDNEQVIKSLRDKISEQSSELDRVKRAMAAKEELEVTQIEAVYRLTNANKKLETELAESKSTLDDATQKLETTRTSLEGARRELGELQRDSGELRRRRDAHDALARERDVAAAECEGLREQLRQLRAERVNEEKRWVSRCETLRREAATARSQAAALEAASPPAADAASLLLPQLAALQTSALQRDRAHATRAQLLAKQIDEAETSAAKAGERERVAREEAASLREQLAAAAAREREAHDGLRRAEERADTLQRELQAAVEKVREGEQQLAAVEAALQAERSLLLTERRRAETLQEQLSARGDVSPSHSLASDSISVSLWPQDEGSECGAGAGGVSAVGAVGAVGMCGVEQLAAAAARRGGEARALAEHNARLQAERRALRDHAASLQHSLDHYMSLQEQYDALLQMYGEKEEQVAELRLDLQDVTLLYKAQLDELVALKQRRA